MFCPKCRAEYFPEVHECPDCRVPLVEALPPEQVWDYVDLVAVYTAYDQGQLAMVKSILDAAEIRYFAQGEAFTSMGYPMHTGIRIQVARADAEDAKVLLAGLDEADAGEEDPPSPDS